MAGQPPRVSPAAWGVGLCVGAVIFVLALTLRDREPPVPSGSTSDGGSEASEPPESSPTPYGGPDAAEPAGAAAAADATPAPSDPLRLEGRGGLIGLIVDDVGRRVSTIDRFEALGVDVTYAALPFEVRTSEVVQRIRQEGAELLVHLPMEGGAQANPGPGALMASMTLDEIRARTARALDAVPEASGVNNHMGSVFSSREPLMRAVLEVVGERDLFFVDSRTSAGSVGFQVARELEIATAARDVFLDSNRTEEAIDRQFDELLRRAEAQGSAIAIGHPYDETLAVLERRVPQALELGFRFVPVSYLLERTAP